MARMTPEQMQHFLRDVQKNLPKEMARRKIDPTGQNVTIFMHEKDMYGKPLRLHGKLVARDTSGLTFEVDGASCFIPLREIRQVEWGELETDREEGKTPSS